MSENEQYMSRTLELDGSTRFMALFLAFTVGLSVLAGGVTAAPSDELSYDGDTSAPNPYFDVDSLTVASHPMDQGTSDENMAGYYDDSGNWEPNPEFVVNTTSDTDTGDNVNPYTFQPAHVQADFYSKFPRTGTNDDGEQLASAIDSAGWSKSGANSSKLTISDTEVAEGADAVNFATDGSMGNGDVATGTYNNWTSELDSDESKRVLQIAGDINTLDSGTTVDVVITDESGDTKTVTIDASASGQDVENTTVASSTGTFVYQQKLSDISTSGGGDWSNIESIKVTVNDGDADVSFSWVDMEKKGMTTLGEEVVDSDADGTYDETNEIESTTGSISVHSMGTLDSAYDDAVINDVSFPAKFRAQDLQGDSGNENAYITSFESADQYPSFDEMLSVDYRMKLPGTIDLSYSGVDLQMDQGWPSSRYTSLGVAEGVADSTGIENATLTDKTGQLADSGDTVTLDSTVQVDTGYVVGTDVLVTSDEKAALQDTGGGAGAPAGGSNGGIISFLTSLPGMLLSIAGGILGVQWLKGRGS